MLGFIQGLFSNIFEVLISLTQGLFTQILKIYLLKMHRVVAYEPDEWQTFFSP